MPKTSHDTRSVAILGTGHALPATAVTSTELDHRYGRPSGTTEAVGGVRQRHFAAPDETAALLGAQAARQALAAAGIGLAEIDCLVAASGTMDQGMPSNAALIHRELGLSAHATPAFDVNASCLSFLAALDTLSWPIAAGRYRRVLIVAADIASCGLDWDTLEASAIFGDGAAAAVIGPSGTDPGEAGSGARILAADLATLSEGADLCRIPAGGSRHHPSRIDQAFDPLTLFRMDGKGVFKLASTHLPGFVERLLASAGVERDRLDWIVPHQASHLALAHLTKRLGFARDKVVDIFAEHGNQIAASLPTALDIAIRDGRIRRGQTLLLIGTGAGLSLGGMVLEY
jgi:3-oxoacyl-[acyl-carrier-protein] synthase-3